MPQRPIYSRRDFLSWVSASLAPLPLRGAPLYSGPRACAPLAPVDYRLTPRYRVPPPLEEVIREVQPGLDAFVTEKYAEEIEGILKQWNATMLHSPPDFQVIAKTLSPELSAYMPKPSEQTRLRSDPDLEILRLRFAGQPPLGREPFFRELVSSLDNLSRFMTAEFKLTSIKVTGTSPLALETRVRYDLVGSGAGIFREERIGNWALEWERTPDALQIRKWQWLEETRARAFGPIFTDITSHVLGRNSSYAAQLLRGTDYWRTVLDGACGIDVYGNNGVAAGDIDNDGFDDLYVCQPAGLPNRLYRNGGDGTFEDVTDVAGVGVLDSTPCALFADLDNDGYQDLLVVRSAGPLVFLNQKNGKFRFQPDAFRFAQPAQGTFTGAALADYDRDGRLDVYFCLYLYYQGLDQYRFPVPYYDAQNGPPNFLFHNNGDGTFSDVTAAAGMNQNNNRFTFACGWCDYDEGGWPDLYVANDFGRNNLYRNKGDGTFTDVAGEAGVEDVGAGMSVCWFDYDNDGKQDLYVSNMWSAAGQRVTTQEEFMKGAGENVRALFRQHANGNSLFHNEGNGRFRDTSSVAGVEMGRWAWSSDAWDFDHDGYPDLFVANGMISGPNRPDLESFFWRQVVAHSPLEVTTSRDYEQGWNAINELIRSDDSWSGYERNVFYVNGRDGTFLDASGAVGLDFPDDSRAFALIDFDHDGRLELFLKNRTAPQLRILRNEMRSPGDSIAFRLRGTKSNRDAIGARVSVEAGSRGQTKFLQAGSGFLSQHTKELFFGLGKVHGPVRATVRWPSGLLQEFRDLPPNGRIEIEESSERFLASPFVGMNRAAIRRTPQKSQALPSAPETWLLEPVPAPDFALPDVKGRVHTLKDLRGSPVLINLWAISLPACRQELEMFEQKHSEWARRGLRLLAVNASGRDDIAAVRDFLRARPYSFSILLANDDFLAIYNIFYHYLFDRRRDLSIPTSFLIDAEGLVVKVYQGPVGPKGLEQDLSSLPQTPPARSREALPFPGQFYGGEFQRNHFTYGVAYFQRGYLDQAINSFEFALRSNPNNAEAHYNLGILYLKKKMPAEAGQRFRRALELQPDYPDALNNLGLLAAEQGQRDEAIGYFREAIRRKPGYTIALENLGNLYRQLGRLSEAQPLLERALASDPEDPEVNYSLGMLFAQKEDTRQAREYLERARKLRPDYPEAINNLGVLYLHIGQQAKAIATFQDCIRVAPAFDQPYLNLAKVYVSAGEPEKAQEILRQFLRQQPNHELARKALEQLTR